MRITKLSIDRFGLRSNLQLDQLSSELNLVYGPNGTGKTTAIQFVRWVLFGRRDDTTRRYLSARRATSAGSLSAKRGRFDFTIRREDDGTPPGQVSVTGNLPDTTSPRDTQALLGGIVPDEFDRLCVLSFDRPLDIQALIDSAHARGLELICQSEADPRKRELESKLNSKRRELNSLAEVDSDLRALQNRRKSLRRQLESATELDRKERTKYRNKLEQLSTEIKRIETELAALRDAAREVETKVTVERRNNETSYRAQEKVPHQFLEHRRQQLAEMDAELDCWCCLLDELRKARKQRESVLERHGSSNTTDSNDRPDGRACPVDPVAQRVSQLRNQWSSSPSAPTADTATGRANLAQTLDWLQADVGRLCQQLQDGRSEARRKAIRGEVSQLRICYESLNRVVETVRQRREDLAYELWAAERGAVSIRVAPKHGTAEQPHEAADIAAFRGHDDVTVSVCGCVPPDTVDTNARQQREGRKQEALRRKIQERQHSLRELRNQLQQFQAQPQELHCDASTEKLQRELRDTESRIVALDERDCLRRATASLEQELERLEDQVTRPAILREASAMLRRLTCDRYVGLRITPERQLSVEALSAPATAYEHLSHGTRDQVYLCLGLAILAAYRQRGIELPVILNDAFVNVDSQRGQAMAELVNEYASAGNQVLLFTRHRHVIELFRNRKATLFELRPAGESENHRPTGPTHATVEFDERNTAAPVRRASHSEGNRPQPEHEQYVIRRRQWTAEEFPGELTDRVRVVPRDRSGLPATRARQSRQDDVDTTEQSRNHLEQQEPSSRIRQHVQLQFYLTPSDPVIDAPSIGRQTARKLERLGVKTVAELRSLSPETAVARIGDSRINLDTIRQWQAQSNLMCRIPRLRALDARALVNCGVTTVEKLAQTDPRSLRKSVGKTVRAITRETADDDDQSPDLATVTSWVAWAKSAKARRAA